MEARGKRDNKLKFGQKLRRIDHKQRCYDPIKSYEFPIKLAKPALDLSSEKAESGNVNIG